MKKLLLSAVMLLSVGQMWSSLFPLEQNCLKPGFYDRDPNALKRPIAGEIQTVNHYTSVKKNGPGTPVYEQYKKCMLKKGKKPALAIYVEYNTYNQPMG